MLSKYTCYFIRQNLINSIPRFSVKLAWKLLTISIYIFFSLLFFHTSDELEKTIIQTNITLIMSSWMMHMISIWSTLTYSFESVITRKYAEKSMILKRKGLISSKWGNKKSIIFLKILYTFSNMLRVVPQNRSKLSVMNLATSQYELIISYF